MFDNLSDRLTATLRVIGGKARLTEENIGETLREVRRALLEADVALDVVKQFVDRVRERAIGMEVSTSLSPGQAFVKVVHEELVHVMGDAHAGLELPAVRPPAVILLAGLQGAGKTTTVAKLAKYLKEREKKQVSWWCPRTCVGRPPSISSAPRGAGGRRLHSDVDPSQDPVEIAKAGVDGAKQRVKDVLIVDTAGRLAVDEELMDEVRRMHAAITPAETLFVVDAMTGQDAANTARAFAEALPLSGVVLSKADGDARGGAALSVRQVTGKPIKFLGIGEKTDALEPFHPERMASRILGMGDVLTLIEEAERKLDKKKADKLARKMQKGKGFDLEDFRDQLQQMKKMGGMAGCSTSCRAWVTMGKAASPSIRSMFDQMEAMIGSMTPHERAFPDVINGSRKQRIARGSGVQIQDVNRLLKQHKQMQKMMKKLGKKGGMQKMMRGMSGMMGGQGGGMPPGGMPPGFRR